MWRSIKAVSVLLTISFGFWSSVNGTIPPWAAFLGMVVVILGAEGIEQLLAAAGGAGNFQIDVTLPGDDDEE